MFVKVRYFAITAATFAVGAPVDAIVTDALHAIASDTADAFSSPTTTAIVSATITGVATASGFMNATKEQSGDANAIAPAGPDWQTVVAVVSAILIVVLILTGVMWCKITRVTRSEQEALELREAHSDGMRTPVYGTQHVEHAAPADVAMAKKEVDLYLPANQDLDQDQDTTLIETDYEKVVEETQATPPPPPASPIQSMPVAQQLPAFTGGRFNFKVDEARYQVD